MRPTGFEPVTLCSGGIRSNPTELRAHIYLYEWVKVAFLIVYKQQMIKLVYNRAMGNSD